MTRSNCLLRCVLGCTYSWVKITYILTSALISSEQFLRALWKTVSRVVVLTESPDKTETYSFLTVPFMRRGSSHQNSEGSSEQRTVPEASTAILKAESWTCSLFSLPPHPEWASPWSKHLQSVSVARNRAESGSKGAKGDSRTLLYVKLGKQRK